MVLQQIPTLTIEGGSVGSEIPLAPSDCIRSNDELTIVGILKKEAGICERRKLQQAAMDNSISEPKFWRFANYSPLVTRICQGVYGLVGAKPPPGAVAEIQADRSVVSGGVVDRGWTSDGQIWIAIKMSSSGFETGVVGIPSAVRQRLLNEYTVDGLDATIRIGDTNAWGFRTAIDELGAEPGDIMTLIFDQSKETVNLNIDDGSIIDKLIDAS